MEHGTEEKGADMGFILASTIKDLVLNLSKFGRNNQKKLNLNANGASRDEQESRCTGNNATCVTKKIR